jgi:hypothetical protein
MHPTDFPEDRCTALLGFPSRVTAPSVSADFFGEDLVSNLAPRRADSLIMLACFYEFAENSCAMAALAMAAGWDKLATAALADAVAALRLRAAKTTSPPSAAFVA